MSRLRRRSRPKGPTFDRLINEGTLYFAHRGGQWLAPENTDLALARSDAYGNSLEFDVQSLSDANLGIMHDTTVDATTTDTGSVNAKTSAEWKALTLDTNGYWSPIYGNLTGAPLFDEVLNLYGRRRFLFMENKADTATSTRMAERIRAAGMTKSVLAASFTLANLSAFHKMGIATLFLDTDGLNAGTPWTLAEISPAKWIAVDEATASDATISELIANGINVMCYTVNRRSRRDALLALGVKGFICDDPSYVRGLGAGRTTDPFSTLAFTPGFVGSVAGNRETSRGLFKGDNRWGYNANPGASRRYCLMGWAAPLGSAYTITATITMDALPSDTSRFAGIGFGFTNDLAWNDAALTGANGYHAFFRANGEVAIGRVDNGSFTSLSAAGSADDDWVAGVPETVTITVTATQITVARGAVRTVGPVTDSTYRGAYLYLGMGHGADTSMAISFSGVTIS